MLVNNFGDIITPIQIAPIGTVNATGNTTGVDIGGDGTSNPSYEGQIALILASSNTAGSSPTLAVKLQHSDSSGSGYTDVTGAAFTGLTTSTSLQKIVVNKDQLKRYVRLDYVLGGTSSPAYNLTVVAAAVKKYPA
jgi:hypothetical protein